MAERGYCPVPWMSWASALARSPRSIRGSTEKRYCCSSVDGGWATPSSAQTNMHRIPANNRTRNFPINGRIRNGHVSTGIDRLKSMVLLVLMLWSASGAAGGSTATARAHLGSGNQLMQAERYGEAAEEFRQALQQDPRLAPARDQLAICHFELRNYTQARPLFEQMLAVKGSASIATYYLGRMDLIEHNLDSAIRRFRSLPRDNPVRDELYYLGSAYYKQEKYQQSIEVLKQAAIQNPRDARVHQLLARGYQKLGQGVQAEIEFAETR